MNIQLNARHMDVTPAIRQYTEDKAGKLERFYDRISSVEVILDIEAGQPLVEVIVTVPTNQTLVGTHRGEDLYGCIDNALHKVEQQLRKHKDKVRDRKGPSHEQQADMAPSVLGEDDEDEQEDQRQ